MIELPASYLAQPRWWTGGQEWLMALPALVEAQCARWGLRRDGAVRHGSHALVVEVRRSGTPLALRIAPPDDDVAAHAEALRCWAGRGTVVLVDADPAHGALLLERLDAGRSLEQLPVLVAARVLGDLMRRLAVPVPTGVRTTGDVVRERAASLVGDWDRLGQPLPRAWLEQALEAADRLSRQDGPLAVNADLHSAQVLDRDGEWVCVDPVLLRGDRGYDLARVLWHRLDELEGPAAVEACLEVVVDAAGLDPGQARDGALFRAVDYWLWGLAAGLTEDPVRCRRLVAQLAR